MDLHGIIRQLNQLNSNKDWWDYITTGIVAFSSLLTLFIALKLFKKLSFKRHILEKQLDTVFQLITILQNWTIYINVKGLEEDGSVSQGYRRSFFDFNFDKTDSEYKKLFLVKNYCSHMIGKNKIL